MRGQSGLEAKVASRPKFWPQPRPRSFGLGLGLGLKHLASAWPRSRCLLCNLAFSGKNRVKFRNFINFSGAILKSYVVNHYLVLFHNYFWPRPWPKTSRNWPRPRPRSSGFGLGLEVLALFNITDAI